MNRIFSLKDAPRISPLERRESLIKLCKSNLKANRSSTIQNLRKYDRRQVASSLLEEFGFTKTYEEYEAEERDILIKMDYEYIMNSLMTELSEDEYYEDCDDGADISFDSLGGNQDSNGVLCPVCRLSTASLDQDSASLQCSCGLFLSLHNMSSLEEFKDVLAGVFDRHRLWSCGQCRGLSNNLFPLHFSQPESNQLQASCSECSFSEKVI